jgi:hypothetical protein
MESEEHLRACGRKEEEGYRVAVVLPVVVVIPDTIHAGNTADHLLVPKEERET